MPLDRPAGCIWLGMMHWLQLGLQESFDPIIDVATGQDLVPAMVYAQALGDWDFTGMFTLILYHQVRHVSFFPFGLGRGEDHQVLALMHAQQACHWVSRPSSCGAFAMHQLFARGDDLPEESWAPVIDGGNAAALSGGRASQYAWLFRAYLGTRLLSCHWLPPTHMRAAEGMLASCSMLLRSCWPRYAAQGALSPVLPASFWPINSFTIDSLDSSGTH